MPSVKQNTIDFATVLGASVHDMKNSLFLLLQSIEQVAQEVESPKPRAQLADIHYETQRLNTSLIQLLTLFRHEQKALPVNREEYFLDELADDLVASSHFYAEHHKTELSTEIRSNGSWYFDHQLILVLLNDVLINAMRYATSKVQMVFGIDDINHELVIEVHDDGPGYPQEMLDNYHAGPGSIELSAGRTGLGLFFSRLIAEAHREGAREGSILLSNDSHLGGSRFTLRLP